MENRLLGVAPLVTAGGLEAVLVVGAVADGRICDAGGAVSLLDRGEGGEEVSVLVVLADRLAAAATLLLSVGVGLTIGSADSHLDLGKGVGNELTDGAGALDLAHLLELGKVLGEGGLELGLGGGGNGDLNVDVGTVQEGGDNVLHDVMVLNVKLMFLFLIQR